MCSGTPRRGDNKGKLLRLLHLTVLFQLVTTRLYCYSQDAAPPRPSRTIMPGGSALDPVYVLRGSDSAVTALRYRRSPDEAGVTKYLWSGSESGQVSMWDLHTWRPVCVTPAHDKASVLWIKQHPTDASSLLTQGRDGKINVWDYAQPSWIKLDSITSTALGFCPADCMTINNSTCVVLPTESGSQIDIVCLATKNKQLSLIPDGGLRAYGMCMGICTLGRQSETGSPLVITGYEDGSVVLWDTRTCKELSRVKFHEETVMALDFHEEVNKGISASSDQKLVAWSLENTKTLMKVKEIEVTNPGIGCVCFRSDGKLVVSGGWDGRARIFSSKKLQPLAVLNYHKESVQCAAFSADGALAVGSKDRHISCWSIYR